VLVNDGKPLAYMPGLVEPSTLPRLHAWIQRLKEIPVIKENPPDRERLLVHFKRLRQMFLSDPSM